MARRREIGGGVSARAVNLRAMFKKLRRMVDDVLDRMEAKQDGVSEDDIDRVIQAMREELVETRARITELETRLQSLVRQADQEKNAARTAERRAAKAAQIGDSETVEVANRFAARHRQRLEVLVIKAEATQAEIRQHRDEAAQGAEQLKSAMARRDSLSVQQRRAKAIKHSASRLDSVDAFDRMADKMESRTDLDDATREVEETLDPASRAPRRDFAAERELREAQADAMLEELKRRMSKGK
ncbi:hypothetical protein [Candidatus Palauibacter sp.]|uniref:hypothetical protein n=1 Tax=Candidatus Palauibacter sp. TaxID=3101350 RepID=UPI003C701D39